LGFLNVYGARGGWREVLNVYGARGGWREVLYADLHCLPGSDINTYSVK